MKSNIIIYTQNYISHEKFSKFVFLRNSKCFIVKMAENKPCTVTKLIDSISIDLICQETVLLFMENLGQLLH